MRPFVAGAVKRAIAARRYGMVGNAITGRGPGYLIVPGRLDIAS